MEIRSTHSDGKYVIYPRGELTLQTAHTLRALIGSCLRDRGFCFTLDFRDVTYIDSTGIGTLLSLDALLRHQGGSLQIRNVAAPIMHIIRLARLDGLLPIST